MGDRVAHDQADRVDAVGIALLHAERQESATAAKQLDEQWRDWLDPPGTSETDLKKRTLTNLYNERPTWLQHLHVRLDRAVWAAYGWER
jgi:hypothetical protein